MVPHPFEGHQRASINLNEFTEVIPGLDIIETYNGRSLSITGRFKARRFAKKHVLPEASNSDAHGPAGMGRTWSRILSPPTPNNLPQQLAQASYRNGWATYKGYLEPALNRRRARRDKIDLRNKRK
jgi:predicted metal-dependent phosphoesterase TrpH